MAPTEILVPEKSPVAAFDKTHTNGSEITPHVASTEVTSVTSPIQQETVNVDSKTGSISTPAQEEENEAAANSTSNSSTEDKFQIQQEGQEKESGIKHLDTSMFGNEDSESKDQRLDPLSREFDYEHWLQRRFRDPAHCRKSDTSVAFQNLNIYGFGTQTDYQKTFANYPLSMAENVFTKQRKSRVDILRNFEGLVNSGEMVVVLGRPGSGCSTLLKAISGRMHGLKMDDKSIINYQGVTSQVIHTEFRGECSYQAESDIHFPHLTVGQTLQLAAEARAPQNAVSQSLSRSTFAKGTVDATATALGLAHTLETKVGSSFVLGISGGERKRTSIAEMLVSGSPLQCWDNSTRGLDSANALEFVHTIRKTTRVTGSIALISLYQASQDIYDVFDKVVLLYEGRQIFFGNAQAAKLYFTELGYVCPDRVTTADFLTSLTNPVARVARKGWESRVPRTADEFAAAWATSKERSKLLLEIEEYEHAFPLQNDGKSLEALRKAQNVQKSPGAFARSPYIISIPQQLGLCVTRGMQRLRQDLEIPLSGIMGNLLIAIILGSMFFDLPHDTSSFFKRGAVLFFGILLNTFMSAYEPIQLWALRPIVEKQSQFGFYYRYVEAVAGMICDLPNKFALVFAFNIPIYFLANLRRTPEAFFIFTLFSFSCLQTGSMLFRLMGALGSTMTGSMAPGTVISSSLILYTGFVLPVDYMHPWLRWFAYINPVAYGFESLMINEFSGRDWPCSTFIPEGPNYSEISSLERRCATVGGEVGSSSISGDAYLAVSFGYHPSHMWRNLGIILSIGVVLCAASLLITEYISLQKSKGEVLLFLRGHNKFSSEADDEEAQTLHTSPAVDVGEPIHMQSKTKSVAIETHAATFLWDHITYDVDIKGGKKRILDDVEGWVKPGTLTALMGASGAGKTTLLNILANRASTGVIGGEKLIEAKYQNASFSRKIGYAQQEDLHLETSTVREALIFSALLRQPEEYSKAEKLAYVDEIINTLNMGKFVDAVIGVPGEGLNVEQRKRVTIGVELAARPELLLFLDEPTSGLDSDTAWSICTLLRQLADNGQAILCTIHQPSGILFQMFDRLLFLSNGRSLYFGDIGKDSKTLTSYFEDHGARQCGVSENPAEWILDITGGGNEIDWADQWQKSSQRESIQHQIIAMKESLSQSATISESTTTAREFAAPFWEQLSLVTKRNLQQEWRNPSAGWSLFFATLGLSLLNGISFYHSPSTLQGLQSQIFSIFILLTISQSIVQLTMPQFVLNRTLYEVRERPSRTYSWQVFIVSNMIAEIPIYFFMTLIVFICWFYPNGFYLEALQIGGSSEMNSRAGLTLLIVASYMLWSSTLTQAVICALPDAATGANIFNLLNMLSLIFSGVLVPPTSLPRFWIWMYRVNPFTYFVGSAAATNLAGIPVTCSASELVKFDPPFGTTCGTYLANYLISNGGNIVNPEATSECHFCIANTADDFLGSVGIHWENRWRDFGITLVFTVANVAGALLIYWLARVPKGMKRASI